VSADVPALRLLFRLFIGAWRTDFLEKPLLASPELPVICPRFGEAQCSVRATTSHISVVVVLTVVFPKANRTDVVPAALIKGQTPAARASEWTGLIVQGADRVVRLLLDVPLEPLPATIQFFR
jgi:hypothetical protein